MADSTYLFICSANLNRSIAAEKICRELTNKSNRKTKSESAGVHALANRKVNKIMADKADKIFVMEDYMKQKLIKELNQPAEKIISFDIPDIYPLQDPELHRILTKKIKQYI